MTETPRIPKGFLYRFEYWGKPFWNVLHSVTFTYPDKPSEEDKERVRSFFKVMPYFLPCSICGLHFVKEMTDKPLTDEVLSSMDTLSRWLVELHNSVNTRLKKPLLTYEAIKTFYIEDGSTDPRGAPPPETTNPLYKTAFWSVSVILILLIIVVIALLVIK